MEQPSRTMKKPTGFYMGMPLPDDKPRPRGAQPPRAGAGATRRGPNWTRMPETLHIQVMPSEQHHSAGRMEIRQALTFDDVMLVPAASSIMPGETDTRTRITREIELGIPL